MNLQSLWETWNESQSAEDLNNLLSGIKPVVQKAVTSYAGKADPVIELEGMSLASQSLKHYNPEKAKLQTYLYSVALQPLKQKVHQRAQILKIPQRSWLDITYGISEIEQEYIEKHGVEPSLSELADLTGLSETRIEKLRKAHTAIPMGVLGKPGEETFIEPEAYEPDGDDFWIEAVYQSLDPIDQKIFEWKTGKGGKVSLSSVEISHKLGISESAVSQRIKRISEMILKVRE